MELATTGDDVTAIRAVFAAFPSGVVAVCAAVDGVPVGMAMSTFTGVSLDPPLVGVYPDRRSTTWLMLRGAPRLGISVLADSDERACRQLSRRTGDRFAGLAIEQTSDGAILLGGAAAWLDCTLHDELPAGDHTVALLRIERMQARADAEPLVFHSSRFRRLAPAPQQHRSKG